MTAGGTGKRARNKRGTTRSRLRLVVGPRAPAKPYGLETTGRPAAPKTELYF